MSTAPRPHAVEAEHDAGDRQGLSRVVLGRSSSGRCHNCGRRFESLQGAVSHGRAAKHLVEGTYIASFLYVPRSDGGS